MTTETKERVEDLEGQLKVALKRAETAEAQAEELKPTRDVSAFLDQSEKGIRARLGEEKLKDIAQRELVSINKRRLRDGMPPHEYSGQELEDALERVIVDIQADREREAPPAEGPLHKTIKMLRPDGILVQIPYEDQINNLAGSISDATARYIDKGFKLTEPTLCPSQNCYNPGVVVKGKYTFGMYCSEDHQSRTERKKR